MSLRIEFDIPRLNGDAKGSVTALAADGSVVHVASGCWTRPGTRERFSRDVANAVFPDPQRKADEDDAVWAARSACAINGRAAAVEEVRRLLLEELSRLRQVRDVAKGKADAVPSIPRAAVPLLGTPQRPRILIDTDEHRVVAEVIAALSADDGLFHRGGRLVRVGRERSIENAAGSGRPVIQPMPAPSLRERVTRHAMLTQIRTVGRNEVEGPAHPPQWLVDQVHVRGEWPGIRPLLGVSESPFLRPDGTVCQEPGYDKASGVLYEPTTAFPRIHPDVAIDEAVEAIDALREVVVDFPFEAPEHESAWLAGLLTVLGRFAFGGPAPAFLVDANVRGAGKGKLANAGALIATGQDLPVSLYSHDPEEMRKKITTVALNGDRLVLWDNLEGTFGDPAIDAALTTTVWKDRLLSKNENPGLPLFAVHWATGNNVAVAGDTARRIIHIRLNVLLERPEDRTGFRHADLNAWLRANRPRLLAAGLTVLAAYCNAGRPDQGLVPLGSYEGWSRLVRHALVWAGLPDPALTQRNLADRSDATAEVLRQLIDAWRQYDDGSGIFVGTTLARLYPADRQYAPRDDAAVAMRAALEALTGAPPGKVPTARQVGNRLKAFRKRVTEGAYLDADEKPTKYGVRWRLIEATVGPAGDSGESGETVSNPYACGDTRSHV